jgi:hypothetical protein
MKGLQKITSMCRFFFYIKNFNFNFFYTYMRKAMKSCLWPICLSRWRKCSDIIYRWVIVPLSLCISFHRDVLSIGMSSRIEIVVADVG